MKPTTFVLRLWQRPDGLRLEQLSNVLQHVYFTRLQTRPRQWLQRWRHDLLRCDLGQEFRTLVARHGMSSTSFQSYINTYINSGYKVSDVTGYSVGGVAYYAALWEK